MSPPLEGLTVLDLSRLLPGGFCSCLLADFGADVIKVEDTGAGDYVRWTPPGYDGADPSASGAPFLALNRGKRSIQIDLKSAAGVDVLLRLVRGADVLLESFRPGVMDRLGVGYERLRRENPGLVYCSITGYGQDGPYRDRAGHDSNYLALSGLLGLTGEPTGPPIQAAGQIADHRWRRVDGRGRDPDRPARARSLGRGPVRRLLDVRRRAVLAGARRRRADGDRRGAAPRRAAAGRALYLLSPLRVCGWLGLAGRAGAEVLAGVVRRRGASAPASSMPSTRPARTRTTRFRRSSARAPGTSGWRSPASTTAAWSRCSSSTRRLESELVRAREMVVSLDAAGGRAARGAAGTAVQAEPDARRPDRGRLVQGSASTPTRCCRRPASVPDEIEALHADGAVERRPTLCRLGARPSCRVDRGRVGGDAEDVRARAALGRERRHDQALPARGRARS